MIGKKTNNVLRLGLYLVNRQRCKYSRSRLIEIHFIENAD